MLSVVIAATTVTGCASLPGTDDFLTRVPAPLHPTLDPSRAAAAARAYLDAQRDELAAPDLHRDPDVTLVTLVRASDAPLLAPLPWSSPGDPAPCGTIVIDDDTAVVLGVYLSTDSCAQ